MRNRAKPLKKFGNEKQKLQIVGNDETLLESIVHATLILAFFF